MLRLFFVYVNGKCWILSVGCVVGGIGGVGWIDGVSFFRSR